MREEFPSDYDDPYLKEQEIEEEIPPDAFDHLYVDESVEEGEY